MQKKRFPFVRLTGQLLFKIRFQNIDQHTGGKGFNHGTKHHKDNQLQSQCLRFCVYSQQILVNNLKTKTNCNKHAHIAKQNINKFLAYINCSEFDGIWTFILQNVKCIYCCCCCVASTQLAGLLITYGELCDFAVSFVFLYLISFCLTITCFLDSYWVFLLFFLYHLWSFPFFLYLFLWSIFHKVCCWFHLSSPDILSEYVFVSPLIPYRVCKSCCCGLQHDLLLLAASWSLP